MESANRLEIPRMFTALVLLSLTGLALNGLVAWIENRLLRNWHAGHQGR